MKIMICCCLFLVTVMTAISACGASFPLSDLAVRQAVHLKTWRFQAVPAQEADADETTPKAGTGWETYGGLTREAFLLHRPSVRPENLRASWTPGAADIETGHLLRREMESSEGSILGSDLGFLLLSGHTPVYQPYQFGHLARAGRWPQNRLEEAVEQGAFSVILLKGNAETGDDPFFSAGLQERIHRTYELHRVIGPWHLYRRW